MRREYYLHKRQSGIYYVEFIDKVSGKKLTARSTGETNKTKTQFKAELWQTQGVPTGRLRKPRPIEETAGVESVTRAIRRAGLNSDDALRIVSTLKGMRLIDIAAVKNTGRGAVPFIGFLESFWGYDKSEHTRDQLIHGHRFTRRYANGCLKWVRACSHYENLTKAAIVEAWK